MITGLILFFAEHLLFGWCLRDWRGWIKALLRAIAATSIVTGLQGRLTISFIWILLGVFVARLTIDWLVTESRTEKYGFLFWKIMGANEAAHMILSISLAATAFGQPQIAAVLVALEVKHFLADWVLTSNRMAMQKGLKLFGPWLVLHVAIHVIGSAFVLGSLGVSPEWLIAIETAEYLVHSGVDRAKGFLGQICSETKNLDSVFGRFFFGGDQVLHHATYLVMALVAVAVM